MDEKRAVDYFVSVGLPEDPEPLDEYTEDISVKACHRQDPIIEIAVINKTLGELPPQDFKCVEFTPNGFPADLNHGSLRAPELNICFKRGRDKPPLTDIGVLYEGKERVMDGCEVVYATPQHRSANVNNSNNMRIYITYRRAQETAPADTLVVMDICVIVANKGEVAPHAYHQIEKNLNKGMMGSDVYLCYKKSMGKNDFMSYKAAILGRYPLEDYPGLPLPERVPMFCLPLGASLESWSPKAQHPSPQFSTFVLTMEYGEKVYGASVSFYEEVDDSTLTTEQKQELGLVTKEITAEEESPDVKTVHATKSICLLSRWPFFDTYRRFLAHLYRVSKSGPHEVPIERLICHFLHEVPYPSPQRPRILVQFSGEAISLSQPQETPLTQNGASFITLLKNLGPENSLTLITLILLEHKVLIHSLRHAELTSAAEAITSIVFPLQWQCPYIPLCPLGLSGVLSAPTPFIVGVDSRYFDLFDPPSDVVCVDLDTNSIKVPDDKKNVTYKLLPKKPAKLLKQTLEKLFDQLGDESSHPLTPIESGGHGLDSIDSDFSRKRKQLRMETSIQEAFLRFMAYLLKGYNNFLLPIIQAPTSEATDLGSLFDIQGFVKTRDKAHQKFFSPLVKTQLFTRFIEERSFVSDKDASLAFFDECTEKVSDMSDEPKLIELDDASRSERTVFILPPEPTGLPENVTYSYTHFPILNPTLFPDTTSLVNPLVASLKLTPCPNSPMTRRTKHEVKSSQRIAVQQQKSPQTWAKYLLGNCYSLWFIHLPSYIKCVHSKNKALRTAYDVLVKMQAAKLQHPDEVCYRVLLQLCGLYKQPVLAVKVFFEMRQHGIQPNAITYGFYNKAVLESKWPTSDTNAFQLWTKVKHVVQALAQFKQALKNRGTGPSGSRRPSSMCYTSEESEYDQISRASTDSFLDDFIPLADRADMAMNKEQQIVMNMAESPPPPPVPPGCEERVSTGGMSDKGYSSMTLDDSKRTSLIISSEDSIDSLERVKNVGVTGSVTDRRIEMRPKKQNIHRKPAERIVSREDGIDAKTDAAFQERIGSIVRKSSGSIGSTNTLRGSSCSSAGLLMTSQASVDESVFGEFSISQSLNPKQRNSTMSDSGHGNRKIKEGTSTRPRSDDIVINTCEAVGNSLEEGPHQMVVSTHVDEYCENGSSEVTPKSSLESVHRSDSQVEPLGSVVTVAAVRTDDSDYCTTKDDGSLPKLVVVCENCSLARDENAIGVQDVLSDCTDSNFMLESEIQDSCSNAEKNMNESCKLFIDLDKTPTKPSDIMTITTTAESGGLSCRNSSVHGSRSSLKSLTSPTHSIRTPVLENDPLGLFNIEASLASSGDASRSIGNHSNMSLNLGEPFSGTSTPVKQNHSSVPSCDGDRNSHHMREPINSFNSSGASSPASPIREWKPLTQSSSSNTSDAFSRSDEPLNTNRKSVTLPAYTKPPTGHEDGRDGRKGRFVGRSDSFMKSMKSAASGFLSKYKTLKDSVVTATVNMKETSGSSASLPTESPEESPGHQRESAAITAYQKKKSSSLDMLATTTEEEGDQLEREYLNRTDDRDDPPRGRIKHTKGYTPFVRDLWGDLLSSPAVKSVQKGLVSMRHTVKESIINPLSESMALSEDEDTDEEYYAATKTTDETGETKEDDQSSLSSNSKKGSAPPHSLLDNYIPSSSQEEGSDKGSVQQPFGSVLSLPQMFFNCAMEVEMCTLCRCNSCSGLLYDEEVMAGWFADDSNLNTSCQFCNSKLVPLLQIYVKDFRQFTEPQVMKASQSMDSMNSSHSMPSVHLHRQNNASVLSYTSSSGNLLGTRPSQSYPNNTESNPAVSTTNKSAPPTHTKPLKITEDMLKNSVDIPDLASVPRLSNSFNRSSAVRLKPEEIKSNSVDSKGKNISNFVTPPVAQNGPLKIEDLKYLNKTETDTNQSESERTAIPSKITKNNVTQDEVESHGNPPSPDVSQSESELSEAQTESGGNSTSPVDSDKFVLSNGEEKTPTVSVSSPISVEGAVVTDAAETDSIGDVLDGELPYNRELKEPKVKSVLLEPISVPYLSPLVLRKELENVIGQEGDDCLSKDTFVDEHPIIYWNLLWYFKRIEVLSHLSGFMLTAKTTNPDQPPSKTWAKADSRHVQVRAVWDNLKVHSSEIGKPMYVLYSQIPQQSPTVNALVTEAQVFNKSTLQHIVSSIMCNDVLKPIHMVLNDRRKNKQLTARGRFRSMYRDLLFLSFVALGRENIDHDAFDREYRLAYSRLTQRELARLRRVDGPPKNPTLWCRRLFSELEL